MTCMVAFSAGAMFGGMLGALIVAAHFSDL